MSELGGLDIGAPDEGGGGGLEQLSEEAKQRFAASGAAMQKAKKEEKKSRQKDDQVARAIIQFLGEKDYAHLFVLISRLVGRDCPSIFILAILSLIHEGCQKQCADYLKEQTLKTAHELVDANMTLVKGGQLDAESNRAMFDWIIRMQMVLSLDSEKILLKLMIDEKNIDGTALQLATFVLQEFFKKQGKSAPFEKIQPLTASILQTVFEPFIGQARKALQEKAAKEAGANES